MYGLYSKRLHSNSEGGLAEVIAQYEAAGWNCCGDSYNVEPDDSQQNQYGDTPRIGHFQRVIRTV